MSECCSVRRMDASVREPWSRPEKMVGTVKNAIKSEKLTAIRM